MCLELSSLHSSSALPRRSRPNSPFRMTSRQSRLRTFQIPFGITILCKTDRHFRLIGWRTRRTSCFTSLPPEAPTPFGDEDIDYAQRAAENEVLTLAVQVASGRLSMQILTYQPNDYTYTMDDLYLELLVLTNSSASIIVHTSETDGVYDLYFAIDLRSTNSLN